MKSDSFLFIFRFPVLSDHSIILHINLPVYLFEGVKPCKGWFQRFLKIYLLRPENIFWVIISHEYILIVDSSVQKNPIFFFHSWDRLLKFHKIFSYVYLIEKSENLINFLDKHVEKNSNNKIVIMFDLNFSRNFRNHQTVENRKTPEIISRKRFPQM